MLLTGTSEERAAFEQWYADDAFPCEFSLWYLRTVVFKREDDGDWYADNRIQDMWRSWLGRAELGRK